MLGEARCQLPAASCYARATDEEDEAAEAEALLEQLQEEKMICDEALIKNELEVRKLEGELQKLAGHQNSAQKIQLHLQIKKENNALKAEILKLKKKMRRSSTDATHQQVKSEVPLTVPKTPNFATNARASRHTNRENARSSLGSSR